jgi:serine protease Do
MNTIPTIKMKFSIAMPILGKFIWNKPTNYLLLASIGIGVGILSAYIRDLSRELHPEGVASPISSEIIQESENQNKNFLLPTIDDKKFVAKVVEKVEPAVVEINIARTIKTQVLDASGEPFSQWFFAENTPTQVQEQVVYRLGSGFVFNPNGQILTNAHVVKNASRVTVSFADGRTFEGKVLGTDSITDIAVVQIPASNLPYLELGNSDYVQPGQWAIAIGNPLGFRRTVTVGIISGTNRSAKYLGLSDRHVGIIQTDAAINPGNSGGPLLNAHGEVIGVNSAVIRTAERLGFAIPINTAQKIAQQLITKGKAEHPYLGIEIKPNNNRNIFGIRERGVLIVKVTPDSPADKAGLRVLDTIQEINNQPVNTVDKALRLLEKSNVGSNLHLQVQRKGWTWQVTVRPSPLQIATD